MVEPHFENGLLRRVRPFVMLLVMAGCILRFSGLSHTVFRNDEAQTGMFISGASPQDVRSLFDGAEHSPAEVLEFQFPLPGTTWLDTVRSPLGFDPKQAPAYYVAARGWVNVFGPTVASLRSFGAMLGILCLPLVYLLGRELFESRLVGWMAVGLVAVSPLRIVYDREARPYALWAICILLANWLLLTAGRRWRDDRRVSIATFGAYGAAVTCALYTHLLSAPIAAAHLIWIILIERCRWTPLLRATIGAQVLAGLLYLPLGLRVAEQFIGRGSELSWIANRFEPAVWLRGAVISAARIFTDIAGADFFTEWMYFGLVPLLLSLYAVAAVVWKARPESRLFVLLLAASSSLPMLATDLVSGGVRMWRLKYQYPSVFALQLCVAFAIATLLASPDRRQRIAAIVSATVFAAAGCVSGVEISRAEIWWHSGGGRSLPAISKHLNASDNPTLIVPYPGPYSVNHTLALSHRLNDDVRLLLVAEKPWPMPPRDRRNVFLHHTSIRHRDWVRNQGWHVEKVQRTTIYRLRPR